MACFVGFGTELEWFLCQTRNVGKKKLLLYWVPILSLSKYGKIATVQEHKNAQNKYCLTLKQHIQTNMDIINLENKTNYPVSPYDMCLNKCMQAFLASPSGLK